jgi:hypothetical protein
MGVLLVMDPMLLGFIIFTMCLVALILSTAILIFACRARTNINVNLSIGPLIFSFLSGTDINGLIEVIKSWFNF